MAVTIKDVARASGVSPSTVSFVLNSTQGQVITPATQQRVREAAHSLGYVPHGVARALREGTSRVVLLDVGARRGGPILEGFILGMSTELAAHGHSLLVQHGTHDHALPSAIAAVSPRAVVDISGPFRHVNPEAPEGGWVYGLASHALTQLAHLRERGHSVVAFATPGPHAALPHDRPPHDRLPHLAQAAERLGLAAAGVLAAGADRDSTARAIAGLLRRHPEVTAVAAVDDETALAVLSALPLVGLAAPGDLAVIGFGDSEFGALWAPALTTVHVEAEQLGAHAARVAIGLDPVPEPTTGSRVVIRESA
ncbi:LacI family DNA-binding transcriptional regulator [Leifsonia aquatica]|uniref:LacI family DNA-binding transcriptional regulator n=1 Tax=Leifsonia aquatica TaxID=144185 RepID=UPI000469F853|nr:LacI family DNA-binding transcriptional regulator [Leifsonia aquatica]